MKKPILKFLVLSGFVWVMAVSHANAGYALRLIYDGITGSSVINLTTNASFPATPLISETIGNTPDTNGLYLFASAQNIGDNYGSWTRGYLEAPATGAYAFWIASDDASELWLSTDTNVANKALIAQVNDGTGVGSTTVNQWDKFASQKSTNTINLVKSQKYYFEVLHKEGTGADHFEVGWTLPDGTQQRPLPGYALFPYLPPGTPFVISQQPQSLTVDEARQAVFFVNVDSETPAATFQWYKVTPGINTNLISGATLSSYVIDRAALSDAADYRVRITYPGQPVIDSDPATLTVNRDVTAPTIVLVDTRGYDTLLEVVISEAVTPVSAATVANYAIDNGSVAVSNATLLADGLTVRLRTSQLNPEVEHTLRVGLVADLAAIPNYVNASVTFGLNAVLGSIRDRVYTGLDNSENVAGLTTAASFPDSPNIITNLTSFLSPGGGNWLDNYGQYIQGWLVPDTTGDYSFAVAGDGCGQLWLGTNDTKTSKVKILDLLSWTAYAPIQYNKYPAQQQTASTAIPSYHLVAGTRYYIEALQKVGDINDFVAVAWQLGGGNITNGTAPISGANLIPYAEPTVPLSIATQPQSQTIIQSRPVTFSVQVAGSPTYMNIQWYRNGTNIPGATSLNYTVPAVSINDNNAVFYTMATNLLYSATSSNAVLTVTSDTTRPTLLSVTWRSATQIVLAFSEILDPATAQNTNNYVLSGGVTVTGAALDATGTNVVLGITAQTLGTQYVLTINGVNDAAIPPNTIAVNTKTVFQYSIVPGFVNEEFFTGLGGGEVLNLTSAPNFINDQPDSVLMLVTFESPRNRQANAGNRVSGYVTAPETGDYVFYIAADNAGELWLSTDESPANKAKIAYTTIYTPFRNWAYRPEQSSTNVIGTLTLVSGHRYYIEALHAEDANGNHMSAGWTLPSQPSTTINVIGSAYLSGVADVQIPLELKISGPLGGQVTLSWALDAVGFELQTSPVLPATIWTSVAGSQLTNSVSITVGSSNNFFRLKK